MLEMIIKPKNQNCEVYFASIVALVERNANPNGYKLLNAYNVGRHDENDIISLASQIQNADVSLRNVATSKLTMILDQIKFLQAQAQKILEESESSMNLHKAACNFRKGKCLVKSIRMSNANCFSKTQFIPHVYSPWQYLPFIRTRIRTTLLEHAVTGGKRRN